MRDQGIDAVIERGNRIADGRDRYIHGTAHHVIARLFGEPHGLIYDCRIHPGGEPAGINARLTAIAFALALHPKDASR